MTVLHMDCRAGMAMFPDNTFDSIVTDPPYELGFMGKSWDATGIAYSVDMWREALRVLKPGGHLLAFSGSRTYHRMTCAIEDAGFEIRDQIMWIYGSGFPKSLDVSKAIDKARTEDVEPTRFICRAVRAAMDECRMKSRDLAPMFGDCHPRLIDHWAARDTDSQPSLPTWGQWQTLRALLPLAADLDAEVWRLNGRKGQPGEAWGEREVVARSQNGAGNGSVVGLGSTASMLTEYDITAPATDAARQWEGWGTALKPAHEPICVARKPLIGTVAANVLQHGTGALNIDGCRVDAPDAPNEPRFAPNAGSRHVGILNGGEISAPEGRTTSASSAGRWPANLIHDGSDEVVALFPDSNGGHTPAKRGAGGICTSGHAGQDATEAHHGNGSAARFFYCAKASKSDRGEGNTHPTVKPTELMRYLLRLVTPPGGHVLDPFAGSGSTFKAASLEGFDFIGFELQAEYVAIANARGRGTM